MLSLIENLGFDGSMDFVTEAFASQPTGSSMSENVTTIPFT